MAVPYEEAGEWALPITPPRRRSIATTTVSSPILVFAAAVIAALLWYLTSSRGAASISPFGVTGLPEAWVGPIGRRLSALLGPQAWPIALAALAVFAGCLGMLRIVARFAPIDMAAAAAAAVLIGLGSHGDAGAPISGTVALGGGLSTTQISAALLLLSAGLAVNGSLAASVALLGLVFDMRPDMAVWGIAAVAGASVALWRDGAATGRAWLVGGAAALLLAAPALWWWGHVVAAGGMLPDTGQMPVEVWTVPLQRWVLFISALGLGLAGLAVLGPEAGPACGAFIGCLAVFAVGCVLPLLTSDPRLLSLPLVDADGMLQLLAVAIAGAVIVRDLRGGGLVAVGASIVIAASLLLHALLLPLGALAMLLRAASAHGELLGIERRLHACDAVVLHRVLVAVVVAAAVGGIAVRTVLLPG